MIYIYIYIILYILYFCILLFIVVINIITIMFFFGWGGWGGGSEERLGGDAKEVQSRGTDPRPSQEISAGGWFLFRVWGLGFGVSGFGF